MNFKIYSIKTELVAYFLGLTLFFVTAVFPLNGWKHPSSGNLTFVLHQQALLGHKSRATFIKKDSQLYIVSSAYVGTLRWKVQKREDRRNS